jgi:uncharacterized protein (DUF58 family)
VSHISSISASPTDFRGFSKDAMKILRVLFDSMPVILQRDLDKNHHVVLQLRTKFPVLAFLCLLLLHLITLSMVSAVGLAAIGGSLAIAYLWARSMALQVSGTRRLLYTALQVGDELLELVELENDSPFPILWAEFVDHSDLPGYSISSVRAVDPRRRIQWRAGAICNRRGLFTLGPWKLHLGDPLSIFKVEHTFDQPEEILVYPPLSQIPLNLLPEGGSQGDYRPLRLPIQSDTVHAVTIRSYNPGDPLRHIHWPTTAKRDELHVKGFEPEGTSTVWIVLDLDERAHYGSGEMSSEESMVTLAASLARDYLHRRLAVGLIAQADAKTIVLPQRGLSHFWSLLRRIAPLHATANQSLKQSLRSTKTLISPRHLVVVLTPSRSADWALEMGIHARFGGGGIMTVLFDPASFGEVGNVDGCAAELWQHGIRPRIVSRLEIQPLHAAYGKLRRWEFISTGTGKVIVRAKPRSVERLLPGGRE